MESATTKKSIFFRGLNERLNSNFEKLAQIFS